MARGVKDYRFFDDNGFVSVGSFFFFFFFFNVEDFSYLS